MPVQTIPVPHCGQEPDSEYCPSHKGKFYDRLTEEFTVPGIGKEGKIHVCEGELWSKCQWIAICTSAERVAVFQITKIGKGTITILNGCRTGEEIFGNPPAGTVIPEGAVSYPVPPQGCNSIICDQVSNVIKTCGAKAVIDLLRNTEDICFSNIPEIEEFERGHLFAGTMPAPCDCPEEYGYGEGSLITPPGIWKSCLRKLTKIFTNLGGRTICFGDAPLYDANADVYKQARSAIFDKDGCLKKGSSLSEDCSTMESAETAEAVIVCSGGEQKVLTPDCNTEIVGCCNSDGDSPKWRVRKRGTRYLDSPVSAFNLNGSGAASGIPNADTDREFDVSSYGEANCASFAVCDLHLTGQTGAGSGGNDAAINVWAYYDNSGNKTGLAAFYLNNDDNAQTARVKNTVLIPIIDGKIKIQTEVTHTGGASNRTLSIVIIGFN